MHPLLKRAMLACVGCSSMGIRGMKRSYVLDCNSMVNICTNCKRLCNGRVLSGRVCMKRGSSMVKRDTMNRMSSCMVISGIDGMKRGSSKVKRGIKNRMSSSKVTSGINGMDCMKLGSSMVKHSR